MLLVGDPSMNGREPAGHRARIATHHPALAAIASPPAPSCATRRPTPVGAATAEDALNRLRGQASRRVIGIGSPRASLESNFALRSLVGENRVYAGIPDRK